MGLESLALFAASTSGFLPGLLSCTEISLFPGISARMEMENAQICCRWSNYTWSFESDIESDTALSWCFYSHLSCVLLPAYTSTLACSPPARKIKLLEPGSSC